MKAFRFFAGVTVALVLAAGPLVSEAQALTKPTLLWCQNCSADQKVALAKTPLVVSTNSMDRLQRGLLIWTSSWVSFP